MTNLWLILWSCLCLFHLPTEKILAFLLFLQGNSVICASSFFLLGMYFLLNFVVYIPSGGFEWSWRNFSLILAVGIAIGFPSGSMIKNPPAIAGDAGLIPDLGKIPWRRKWQPIPVFLPGQSHGQRSLVGYCPRGLRESDTTEWLNSSISNRFSMYTIFIGFLYILLMYHFLRDIFPFSPPVFVESLILFANLLHWGIIYIHL